MTGYNFAINTAHITFGTDPKPSMVLEATRNKLKIIGVEVRNAAWKWLAVTDWRKNLIWFWLILTIPWVSFLWWEGYSAAQNEKYWGERKGVIEKNIGATKDAFAKLPLTDPDIMRMKLLLVQYNSKAHEAFVKSIKYKNQKRAAATKNAPIFYWAVIFPVMILAIFRAFKGFADNNQ